jgi:hypothetical protein
LYYQRLAFGIEVLKNNKLYFDNRSVIRLLLFVSTFCSTLFPVFGQDRYYTKISGQVKDTVGIPLEFVTVALVKAKDMTEVRGTVTTKSGTYTFESIPAGNYLVVATNIGYQKAYSSPFGLYHIHQEVKLPPLILTEQTQLLNEVTVKTRKTLIEQQVDRTILNVENSALASNATVLDILEKAPGVTINRSNDQIYMKGKPGVVIMIDSKESMLSVQEVSTMLKNMPGNTVATIEIITNPSSRYDAAGNSGIINITLKKNKDVGTNGTITTGLGYGRHEKANGNLLLNSRQNDTYTNSNL